ncbi:HAD family hydrolase [Flavobacterium subsaxonicum]|uniref:Lipoprotein n=1 Tax=Flavobacterium subsaxonicum WB 4.1-42 = DSM 21790 TaxID=1121898 RepID=A0A0A2MIU9_9FLAO|nr:hypothetical protein [Flavobacterium subsaxonicum]KGO92194.1 hypothetical protein Q766_13610 [Flavobacterium subsaxonicum WB 4.1-42 = DSM 21790]
MKKITLFTLLLTLIISCSKDKSESISRVKKEELNMATNDLSFDKLKNTRWIIGENGLNGETPDTIIFDKPNKLTYISTDTGKEILDYSIEKDTITYISYSSEANLETDDEINCEQKNKLLFLDTKLKYIYFEQKCSNTPNSEKINMEGQNAYFRKIK